MIFHPREDILNYDFSFSCSVENQIGCELVSVLAQSLNNSYTTITSFISDIQIAIGLHVAPQFHFSVSLSVLFHSEHETTIWETFQHGFEQICVLNGFGLFVYSHLCLSVQSRLVKIQIARLTGYINTITGYSPVHTQKTSAFFCGLPVDQNDL